MPTFKYSICITGPILIGPIGFYNPIGKNHLAESNSCRKCVSATSNIIPIGVLDNSIEISILVFPVGKILPLWESIFLKFIR